MNKDTITELEKIEKFYEDLIYNILNELSEKYKDKKPCEDHANPDIRCAFLGDENRFYNKDKKEFYVSAKYYNTGKVNNINIYNIHKLFNEIFEYWLESYYKNMAIFFEGCQVIGDEFMIRIGFALYDYKEFPKLNLVNVMRID